LSLGVDAKGYYQILEVSPNADISQIKRQYYKLAKYWHPDHNEKKDAVEIFQKISVAYNILKEQKSRLKYDLLSLVYADKDFPDMEVLSVYKNQAGHDDAALRVLKQRRVKALGTCKVSNRKDICNYKEAKSMVLSTSLANWLCGWWGIRAFKENIAALKHNYMAAAANDADNFKLLIHNAVAYENGNHTDMAWIYAKQAYLLSAPESRARELLETYIDMLDFHPRKAVVLPHWSTKELRVRQLIVPAVLGIAVAIYLLFVLNKAHLLELPKYGAESYYQEVELSGGARMADDQIETRIIKVGSGKYDPEYIYHLKNAENIYYGPDMRYDVLQKSEIGQTVRVVGFTPNKKWYKIVIDNGEEGYVKANSLEKGMGRPLPPNSKIR